jgi:hypothetical protein
MREKETEVELDWETLFLMAKLAADVMCRLPFFVGEDYASVIGEGKKSGVLAKDWTDNFF